MYRELKLRGAILENKNLKLLPVEEIVSTVNGVWNLSRFDSEPSNNLRYDDMCLIVSVTRETSGL